MALGFAGAMAAGATEVARGVVVIGYDDAAVTAGITRTETVMRRGSGRIARAILGLGTAFAVITGIGGKMAMNFQTQMRLVQTSAGATAKDVGFLSDAVLKLAASGKSPYGPTELARGLYHLKSLGFDNAKAMQGLLASVQGAKTGMGDLETTTSALGAALRTGIEGTGNMSSAMATLDGIVGAGNMRLENLISALGTGVLPAAKVAGLSLKDVGAALAVMVDQGQNANMAATRLRMSFALMGAPSKKAELELRKIGLSGDDLANAFRHRPRGLLYALELLKSHLDSLPTATAKFQLLARAFGGGRSAGAIMLLINSLNLLGMKYRQIGRIHDRFAQNVAAADRTAAVRIKEAWAKVEADLIKFGRGMLPVLVGLAAVVTKVADAFAKLGSIVGHHAQLFRTLATVVGIATVAYVTYRLAIVAATTAMKLYEIWVLRAEYMTALLNGTLGTTGVAAVAAGTTTSGAMAGVATSATLAAGAVSALRLALLGIAGMVITIFILEKILPKKILGGPVSNHGRHVHPKGAQIHYADGSTEQLVIMDDKRPKKIRGKDGKWYYLWADGNYYSKAALEKLKHPRPDDRAGPHPTGHGKGHGKGHGHNVDTRPPNQGKPIPTPFAIQMETAKADMTKTDKDDLKALHDEQAWIQRQLKRKHLSKAQILDFTQRLAAIDQQIAAIIASHKKKKKKTSDGLVIPIRFGLAISKAKLTKGTADDIAALKAEEDWLLAQIRRGHNSKKRLKELYDELYSVKQEIADLRKKKTDEMSAARAEYMAFMALRGTFFSQFAPNIFNKGPGGKLDFGSKPTHKQHHHHHHKKVEVHQHFASAPESHFVNFREAEFAAHASF